MKKILCLTLAVIALTFAFTSCSNASKEDETTTVPTETSTLTVDKNAALDPTELSETTTGVSVTVSANYNNDFEKDKKSFNKDDIDIVVGDNYFMTQINDWFENFDDYEGKSVEIEGLFEQFGSYYYVGRNGPSCPYCTGGMVTFEINSNYDYSKLENDKSWIKVQGILKKGTDVDESGKDFDFYYIEAINITLMPEQGMTTVTS